MNGPKLEQLHKCKCTDVDRSHLFKHFSIGGNKTVSKLTSVKAGGSLIAVKQIPRVFSHNKSRQQLTNNFPSPPWTLRAFSSQRIWREWLHENISPVCLKWPFPSYLLVRGCGGQQPCTQFKIDHPLASCFSDNSASSHTRIFTCKWNILTEPSQNCKFWQHHIRNLENKRMCKSHTL